MNAPVYPANAPPRSPPHASALLYDAASAETCPGVGLDWATGCVSPAVLWHSGPDGATVGSDSAADRTRAPRADPSWSRGTPTLASTAGSWDTCGRPVADPGGLLGLYIHHRSRPGPYQTRITLDLDPWMPATQVSVPPRARQSCSEQEAIRCTHGESPAELSSTHHAILRQADQAQLARPRRSFAGAAAGARLKRVSNAGSG